MWVFPPSCFNRKYDNHTVFSYNLLIFSRFYLFSKHYETVFPLTTSLAMLKTKIEFEGWKKGLYKTGSPQSPLPRSRVNFWS